MIRSYNKCSLCHIEIFNIRNNYAPSSIAKNFYDIQPCKIYSYQFNKYGQLLLSKGQLIQETELFDAQNDSLKISNLNYMFFLNYFRKEKKQKIMVNSSLANSQKEKS